MNKKTSKLWIGIGAAAALGVTAVAVSTAITKTLIREALDREEPKVMRRLKGFIGGDSIDPQILEQAKNAFDELKAEPIENVTITSFDGTQLTGHWYPAPNPKRILLAMHGWRSTWGMDFGIISKFWHDNGCSVLFAEQRAQGESDGDAMGFGLTERYDCLEWVKWITDTIGNELPLYLVGLSMGATTVLMTAGFDLPENVHGIIADCGFTSVGDIWKHIAQDNLHVSYQLRAKQIKTLCKRGGYIDADSYSTLEAMKTNQKPILFIHGTEDTFVPVEMTYENYRACQAPKQMLIVEGAGHGMSYMVDRERYETAIKDFWEKYDQPQTESEE